METTDQLLERILMENRLLRAHIKWIEDELGLVVDYLAEVRGGIGDSAGERGEGHGL